MIFDILILTILLWNRASGYMTGGELIIAGFLYMIYAKLPVRK